MVGAVRLRTKFKFVLPVPDALVALITAVTVDEPVAEGVPEITPVVVLMLRPAGRPVALKLIGVFVATIV